MNRLKTVDRASDLKLLERKLENIIQEISNDSNRLNVVKRDINLIEQKLEIMNIDSQCENRTDVLECSILKNNECKKRLTIFLKKRESLKKNSVANKAKIESVNSEIETVSAKIAETDELCQSLDELLEKEKSLTAKLFDSKVLFEETKQKIAKVKLLRLKNNPISRAIKGVGNTVKGTVVGGIKSGIKKADPLSGGINKDDVSDTGAESIRLARQSVNKVAGGLKTAKRTVKTTKRSIKTVAETVKATARATYKTAVIIKNVTVTAVRIAVKVATHVVAALFNPILWIAAVVLLIVVVLSQAVIMILGGAMGGGSVMASHGAAGLGDVEIGYQQGVEFLNTAAQNAQNGFNALVNTPVYRGNDQYNGDLANSDLVFLQLTKPDGSVVHYTTAFATNWQKDLLRSAWDLSFPVNDVLAIAYVKLQKDANEANGTTGQIYPVEYTQALFEEIIALMVNYNVTIIGNQPCPEQNCTIEIYYVPNPDYVALESQITGVTSNITNLTNTQTGLWNQLETLGEEIDDLYVQLDDMEGDFDTATGDALSALINRWNATVDQLNTVIEEYNEIVGDYNELGEQITTLYEQLGGLQTQLAATPPELEMETEPFCDSQHDLHSIGLWYYPVGGIMDTYDFTLAERQWVDFTIRGFEGNPNLV